MYLADQLCLKLIAVPASLQRKSGMHTRFLCFFYRAWIYQVSTEYLSITIARERKSEILQHGAYGLLCPKATKSF